jgi:hypothetical protein
VWAGGVEVHVHELLVLVAIGLMLVAAIVLLRRQLVQRLASIGSDAGDRSELDGAAVGMMLVMTATALVLWTRNPFTALLVVPALHLWLWLAEPGARSRRTLVVALLLLGIVAPAVVIAYYASSLGLSVPGVLWAGVLLIAGGQLTALTIVAFSCLLGCLCSAVVIVARSFRDRVSEEQPAITVRGPVTYAGPGSLGGTESALRR